MHVRVRVSGDDSTVPRVVRRCEFDSSDCFVFEVFILVFNFSGVLVVTYWWLLSGRFQVTW